MNHLIKSFIANTSRMILVTAILDLLLAIVLGLVKRSNLITPNTTTSTIVGIVVFVLYVTFLALIAQMIQRYYSAKNLKKLKEDISKLSQNK